MNPITALDAELERIWEEEGKIHTERFEQWLQYQEYLIWIEWMKHPLYGRINPLI